MVSWRLFILLRVCSAIFATSSALARRACCSCLLDVAGPSPQNQGIVAAAQGVFRRSAPELLTAEDTNEAVAMADLCLRLNASIMKAAGRACSCPAFAGCYNEGLGNSLLLQCRTYPGLLRHGQGITELPATGLPLGLFSH